MPIRVVTGKSKTTAAAPLLYGLPPAPEGQDQKPAGISLCMIVKNEERFLDSCLRSVVDVVDEINIVDTGSTDTTVDIARKYTENVAFVEWRNDFAWARNQAIRMATRRWTLVLDADEELDPECLSMLRALKNVPADLTGMYLRCVNVSEEGAIDRFKSAMEHSLVRIFPTDDRIGYSSPVHEYVCTLADLSPLTCVNSPIRIWHYGYVQQVIQERSKVDRNLAIVKEANQDDPTHPFHWYNLGQTLLVRGETQAGVDALEKMWEINGDAPRGFLPVGLTALADAHSVRLGNHERAIEICERLMKLAPNYSNAYFVQGQALLRAGRKDEGRASLEKAIETGSHNNRQMVVDSEISDWKAHNELGVSYIEDKDIESALGWFEKGLVRGSDAWQLHLNRARALEILNRFSEAEEAFRVLHESNVQDWSVIEYVNFLLRRNRFSRALDLIRETAGRVSEDCAVNLLITAATVTHQLGLGGAEVYLKRALELSPSSGATYSAIEKLYHARKDDPAVAVLLIDELDSSPKNEWDFIRRSHVLLKKQDWDGVIAIVAEGLRLVPDQSMLLYNGALACAQIGQRKEARAMLEGVSPESGEVYLTGMYLSAVLADQDGDAAEARRMLGRLLERAADNVDALLLRAQICERDGDLSAAETDLLAAKSCGAMRAATDVSSFYLRHGRFDEAVKAADSALAPA